MVNDILPNLKYAEYLMFIDESSGYHNLRFNEKSSYITRFSCQFCTYRYIRLLFGAAPLLDMFQRKIDEIFKKSPNVFGIADNILIMGYDVNIADHNRTLCRVLQKCRKENLKLNKDRCHFRCTSVLFVDEIISRHGVTTDLHELLALIKMPPSKSGKEQKAF